LSFDNHLPVLKTREGITKTRNAQFSFQQHRTTHDETNFRQGFTPNQLVKFADQNAARREQTAIPKMSSKAEIFRMKSPTIIDQARHST
jgi:hypothetical protein